ncbi:hypothetical protein AC578_245 [Lecanosticta acicola]|uniref:Chitin synthesis regulation, resistance to congo red-domain-containing protein n=1 Tax=Lecanosticta acicola TaxID=111012 RepID=A0AAI8Z3D8_9PEZI|nr:hypothetical protein AC578_245 [Lecanosticta acicola]
MARCYQNGDGTSSCYDSYWDSWVRWLVLALIIIGAFLIFFLFSCVSARRRRQYGHQPYRGTGWALGRTPAGHGAPTYTQQPHYANQGPYYNNSNNPAPPPAYTPPPDNGYYGNNDVELQPPQQSYGGYRSGEGQVYEPPKGPPPTHNK